MCSLFNLNLKFLIAKNDFISDENEKNFFIKYVIKRFNSKSISC